MRRMLSHNATANAFIECSPEGGGAALYIFAGISVREFRIICFVVVVRDSGVRNTGWVLRPGTLGRICRRVTLSTGALYIRNPPMHFKLYRSFHSVRDKFGTFRNMEV